MQSRLGGIALHLALHGAQARQSKVRSECRAPVGWYASWMDMLRSAVHGQAAHGLKDAFPSKPNFGCAKATQK
jgi:hypothetical protein